MSAYAYGWRDRDGRERDPETITDDELNAARDSTRRIYGEPVEGWPAAAAMFGPETTDAALRERALARWEDGRTDCDGIQWEPIHQMFALVTNPHAPDPYDATREITADELLTGCRAVGVLMIRTTGRTHKPAITWHERDALRARLDAQVERRIAAPGR